jgi:hypothetical protein
MLPQDVGKDAHGDGPPGSYAWTPETIPGAAAGDHGTAIPWVASGTSHWSGEKTHRRSNAGRQSREALGST